MIDVTSEQNKLIGNAFASEMVDLELKLLHYIQCRIIYYRFNHRKKLFVHRHL